jgi:4-hydroxythreonine-4-phosphate dehydrogenase
MMNRAGFRYPGQTELVAALAGGKLKPTMMLVAGNFRVALATVHVPLARVASLISRELIVRKLSAVHESLRSDFGIRRPAIAVLGVNPHAGERGLLGREELRHIGPALKIARARKIDAAGPFPADGFFATGAQGGYDAVLAMYHDQGLIPLKMSGFDVGVNFSSGLSVVRTSPDHGTAYALAGRGKANPRSMIEAIALAVRISRNRGR